MSFLALDIGTSFVKGAVLDLRERRIAHIRRVAFPAPVENLAPNHIEIAPQAVTQAVDQLLAELAGDARDCQGVLLCGQMGGVILTDQRGLALTNYLSWRDQRVLESRDSAGRSCWDELRERISGQLFAELGSELRPGSSSTLLYWLVQQHDRRFDGAVPLSLPAFVASYLTRQIPTEDATQAIGLLDIRSGGWHHPAFQRLGLDRFAWPIVNDRREPMGEMQLAGRRVPCYPAVGDHQCALLGVGLDEGELSVNVSTGSQVSRLIRPAEVAASEPGRDESGSCQVRFYFDGLLLKTITHLPAGRSLDALVSLLTELPSALDVRCGDPWPYITQAAEAASDGSLAVDLSFFSGALGDQGAFTGVRLENLTVGNIFRAALRNMARNYAVCARRLGGASDWQRIAFSGGLANRLALLRKFVLDELPGPYRLCAEMEDTLTGLLALALVADGQAASALAASKMLRNNLPTSS